MVKMPSLFGKKKGGKGAPTERVKTLSTQGLSEPEIIATLRREGFTPGDVDKGMRSALKEAVSPSPYEKPAVPAQAPPQAPPQRAPEPRADLGLPEFPDLGPPPAPPGGEALPPAEAPPAPRMPELPPLEELPSMGPPPTAPPADEWRPPGVAEAQPAWRPQGAEELAPMPSLERPTSAARRSEVEEIAEAIIDEKWQRFEMNVSDIGKKLEGLNSRVTALETAVSQSKGGAAPTEVKAIKDSLDAYKTGMSELGSRMEAMERAIKDSLTPMMQSMRSLSEAVKEIKGVKQ